MIAAAAAAARVTPVSTASAASECSRSVATLDDSTLACTLTAARLSYPFRACWIGRRARRRLRRAVSSVALAAAGLKDRGGTESGVEVGWKWGGHGVEAEWIWGGYGVELGCKRGGYGVDMGWK